MIWNVIITVLFFKNRKNILKKKKNVVNIFYFNIFCNIYHIMIILDIFMK